MSGLGFLLEIPGWYQPQVYLVSGKPGTGETDFEVIGTCVIAMVYSTLRNSASGPEIGLPGRIFAGLLQPSGRPKAGRRADFGALPVAVRPKSSPEARFPARKHYCVT